MSWAVVQPSNGRSNRCTLVYIGYLIDETGGVLQPLRTHKSWIKFGDIETLAAAARPVMRLCSRMSVDVLCCMQARH